MDPRTQFRNAAVGAADSLWRAARRLTSSDEPPSGSEADDEPIAPVLPLTKPEPYRHITGRWACCGGYGEHFASCEFATWERSS